MGLGWLGLAISVWGFCLSSGTGQNTGNSPGLCFRLAVLFCVCSERGQSALTELYFGSELVQVGDTCGIFRVGAGDAV